MDGHGARRDDDAVPVRGRMGEAIADEGGEMERREETRKVETMAVKAVMLHRGPWIIRSLLLRLSNDFIFACTITV